MTTPWRRENLEEIEHSGGRFVARGRTAEGVPIWPIEEYLARRKHGPVVAERIARLNPNGKVEGERPNGWYPKQVSKRRLKIKVAREMQCWRTWFL